MRINRKGIYFLLAVMALTETLSYTYLHQAPLYYTTSVLYFVAGLGICVLPLFIPTVQEPGKTNKGIFVPVVFIAIVVALLAIHLPDFFCRIPIDYHLADMLPRIKIYAYRLIHGNYVYDDVKEIWGGNLPPYLPATWVPFIPAVLWDFDLRWVPAVAFTIALVPMLRMARFGPDMYRNFIVLILLVSLFLLVNFQATQSTEFFTMSYEGLIVLYYVLLCMAIISWNPYWIGASIALCLLSRFSLSFWVPVFLIFLWLQESFRFALKSGVLIAVMILVLLIFPFVVGHTDVFLKTIDQYETVTAKFWTWVHIDKHEYGEVGLFKFFSSDEIPLLRLVHLVTTAIAPVAFIIAAVKYLPSFEKKKILIGLCSLKFTLLFFYNFIDMPFHYLFIVPTIITYIICFYCVLFEEIAPV